MKRHLILLLLVVLLAPHAFAWGEKGHYLVNEAATLGLPADMPQFFYRAFPDLVWLAFDPDRWRGAGESIEAANAPDHFLDYEYAKGLPLPKDRYAFIALMEKSGRLRQHGITNSETGFLPWRIAELAETLQLEFRLWRRSTPGSSEREFIERDIVHVAGILGHFVGDASNPAHTTMNFNGWVLANPNGYATDCETHSRFEQAFISHALTTELVTPKLAAPTLRKDYFATAMALIDDSNANVETMYRIDRDHGFDNFRNPPSPEGVGFASGRLAAGASVLRDIWWSAWVNSGVTESRGRR